MANPEKLKEKEILNVEVRDVLVTGSTVKLGRTRTCDLLIRSQTRSKTEGDREGQGETKPCFYPD